MATDVIVPEVGEVGMDVTFVRWLRSEGDEIREGDPLFEVDTAKAVMEVQACASGRLTDLRAKPGDLVAPHQVVARILTDDADGAHAEPFELTGPNSAPAPTDGTAEPSSSTVVSTTDRVRSTPAVPASTVCAAKASPRARRFARDRGVDLNAVRGSGPDGLITERDVLAAAEVPADSTTARPTSLSAEAEQRIERVRREMAERTVESWRTIPHFAMKLEADVTEGLRTHRPTTLITAALVRALIRHPECNLAWQGDRPVARSSVDIGILVDTPSGLLLPAVRNAERLSPNEVGSAIRAAAERARAGLLGPGDASAHSATISNLGMFAVDEFSGVIPTPDVLLLAIGRVRSVPRWTADGLVSRRVATLTLSIDHRALSGADAGRLLTTLEQVLSDPLELAR